MRASMEGMRTLPPVVVALALFGCGPGKVPIADLSPPPDFSVVPHVPRDKVDVLFVLDDTASGVFHARMRVTLPRLVEALEDGAKTRPISYHFGVVTSDLGAPGITCGVNRGGRLQPKGAAATATCSGPTSGNFLVYDQGTPANSTLPATQDLTSTLGCMANVGGKGCGFEMPLEAMYRALHDPIAENAGFLRDDALLAIIMLSDEDDCSTDDPASDLFLPGTTTYGPQTSFRCPRFGLTCDGKFPLPDTAPATYTSCQPATTAQGGKLSSLDKYTSFLGRPKSEGGVKDDPRDVVLAVIDAPSFPVGVTAGSSAAVCGTETTCPVLGHSCSNPSDAASFADPAVRINALVTATSGFRASICDDEQGYSIALAAIGKKIVDAAK